MVLQILVPKIQSINLSPCTHHKAPTMARIIEGRLEGGEVVEGWEGTREGVEIEGVVGYYGGEKRQGRV